MTDWKVFVTNSQRAGTHSGSLEPATALLDIAPLSST